MAQAQAPSDKILDKLAAGVPDRSVKLAYGEKQTVDGVEMIPVAFVSYGFGSGEAPEEGTGGGGGGVAVPVGAYVAGADGLRFRPNVLALLWVSVPVIAVGGWALAKILKASR